ncbi:MAG TPA: patatin-like phospholipase family protein [Dokdonella sp.]
MTHADGDATRQATQAAAAECDLIMKGGIASGIVYPGAIAALAAHYRLRSVGGASAGAIAAAAAAAAEYGRASGGFAKLARLPHELAEPGADGRDTRLFRLFEPQPSTRALYALLVAGLMPDRRRPGLAALRWFGAASANFPWSAFAAAMLALLVVAGLLVGGAPGALACTLAALTGVLVFALALGGAIVASASRRLPANGYGLCTGMGSAQALTPWLHRTLQTLADKPAQAPLTFGDLWSGAPGAARSDVERALAATWERRIDLRLMTTALSHGRPYSFPLELADYCFDEAEMRRLFPAEVVDHLVRAAGAPLADGPLAGKYRLCAMVDLPVVVPVRMSLAFPLLLAAVPLHRIRRDPDRARPGVWIEVAETVWFSDGGLCSNFPIHYFDAPIPARPSFGIDLTDARFVPDHARDPDDYVWLPDHNGSGLAAKVVDVERGGRPSVLGFLGAILDTMQNWNDSTQLAVPGFRDRIVSVRLSADEGGMNLRMHRDLIRRVAARGDAAGRLLLAHFAGAEPPPGVVTGWRNHRWVRYRVAMRLLEQALEGIRVAESESAGTPAAIEAMHADPPSYRFRTRAQERAARAAYAALLGLARRYDAARARLGHEIFTHDERDGPHPRAQLRIRPRI